MPNDSPIAGAKGFDREKFTTRLPLFAKASACPLPPFPLPASSRPVRPSVPNRRSVMASVSPALRACSAGSFWCGCWGPTLPPRRSRRCWRSAAPIPFWSRPIGASSPARCRWSSGRYWSTRSTVAPRPGSTGPARARSTKSLISRSSSLPDYGRPGLSLR